MFMQYDLKLYTIIWYLHKIITKKLQSIMNLTTNISYIR